MTIKQIAVFMENKPGTMSKVTEALGNSGIDVRAASLADTQDLGILRMIVTDTEKAVESLSDAGYVASVCDVFAAEVPDLPGAMTELMKKVASTGLNVEYMYAFVSPETKKAYIVLRIKDTENAEKALIDKGIKLIGETK